jgi:ribosome biogenesis GTPase / thiamine phosphate phosphatase
MTSEERKRQKHLQQRANSELRKAAQKEKKAHRANEFKPRQETLEDDDPAFVRPPRTKAKPEKIFESGLVVESGPGICMVLTGREAIRCKSDSFPAVGDRVSFSRERQRIMQILPRSSALSRPDPHNPRIERVIAANIDVVVNVVSVKMPPLHPGLIDRYLIAIENSGADPLICVNKADLIDDHAAIEQQLSPYRELGVDIVLCSAATGHGLAELTARLAGRTCVFTGHSGVGKSSLLNALAPGLDIATGAVSEVHEKGRHTTAGSKLYRLPGGGVIIDTAGIREFGLWRVTPDQVRGYFHDFDAVANRCAFSDCSHTHEPNCAVIPAVEAGTISRARYESYRRILGSA